ncbi:hypothetical protein GOP47_0025635 [Adiantum capillus-veneris]|uniref:Uncharacterized protein n=1 Tax=Adiantum capillus-veneris TaxID=13818 RepID=A0A9D4U0H8_ADICA|nr:hypothetical protein GOP47_0025635 [Adiantum capillus-veneris]
MERTEPSFIPGWLKGTGVGGGSATHNSPDEGVFSRSKATQQLHQANSNLESPRKSSSSSKSFSSTSRRIHNTNGSVDRQTSDRDNFGLARSKSGLNRNSSNRNLSKINLEQNGYNSWIDGEYGHEVDRECYARKKDWLSGMVPDTRDKDKEIADSPMRQLFSGGLTGKYDRGTKLKRSQSMSMSASGKVTDVVSTVPSANGSISGSSQKSVFEHNFPTLGTEDKQSSPRSSSIASPRPSIANPHLIWQGNSRSDLSRASSPGLTGGYANPMSCVSAPIGGGNDCWSSALADAPTSNGNVTLTSNAVTTASISQTLSFVGPVTSAAPLNMAEALSQNPPRVRTPPQVLLESQRLEELALKQSRQLIPMTPSLPKAMSIGDKTKSKSSRTGDGSTTSLKVQLNSSQKSVTQSKPDNLRSSQGKLLVLKSGKDGGVVMTTTPKSDGTVAPQVASQGSIGLSAVSAGSSTLVQRKQPVDRRVTAVADALRAKDTAFLPDEKRTALNAQNRSDFFNALRKKAAGNGSNGNASTVESKSPREPALANEVSPVDNKVELKENGVLHDVHSSLKVQCNGEIGLSSENGVTKDGFEKDNLDGLPKEESRHSPSPGDLEEEEAAFMRSLGWDEDEECSELTEEEINAFYASLDKKLLLKSKLTGNFQAEHVVGSVGSMSSGLSSSDSETEEAQSFLLQRAVSNSTTYVRR